MDPLLDAQHQRVMEAQYREHMGREMAKLFPQGQLEAWLRQDPWVLPETVSAPLTAVAGVSPRVLGAVAPVQGALGCSGGGVGPLVAWTTLQPVTPVCSPQVQEGGLVLSGPVPDVPVSAGVTAEISKSDVQCLQELRDSQRWAERQEAVLRVQAPVFVPGGARPVNFMV